MDKIDKCLNKIPVKKTLADKLLIRQAQGKKKMAQLILGPSKNLLNIQIMRECCQG